MWTVSSVKNRSASWDFAELVGLNSGAGSDPKDATNRVLSPSTSRICASVASHSRAAFAATVSNTGWISVGELAMTPKISLVAVCCSNDSLSSWNSRTFSMAITAWSAKVFSRAICFSSEWPHLHAGGCESRRLQLPSRSNGVHKYCPNAERFWRRPSGNSSSGSAARSWM